MPNTIKIVIKRGEAPVVDVVEGPGGPGCLNLIEQLGLGDVVESELKDEFYETPEETHLEESY